ncbi:MAG: Adenylate cyclase [Burkholderiaceae bacterium]|jgi:signal transduction histidine kinase|nr:MAG: Adenylate cyclase [Burkholderiaceae bacterium]
MNGAGRLRWRHAAHRARHSLRVRLVLLFFLLALAMTAAFLGGIGRAFSSGWREAANPLIGDYADRLAAEIGTPPSVQRAQAIAERLPIVVRIRGQGIDWTSGPWPRHGPPWARGRNGDTHSGTHDGAVVSRTLADGSRVEFALDVRPMGMEPGRIIWLTLAALLALTVLAYAVVSRMLRPIHDIAAGARRFGVGQFDAPIPVRHRRHPDELNDLARTVNQMAANIRQMLDAKRALLLAISHELRSPLTRARLNAELLPEGGEAQDRRDALLRDLAQMRDLITDLLESERLAQPHTALQREPTDLAALALDVIAQMGRAQPGAAHVVLHVDPALPRGAVMDATRMRLLLRNLLDNALRHSPVDGPPPELSLRGEAADIVVEVRDHGPGVSPEQLPQLAQAFYRPDSARQRNTGGVGLGLYLARLVAQAHGGEFAVRNAEPGLAVTVRWPFHAAAGGKA